MLTSRALGQYVLYIFLPLKFESKNWCKFAYERDHCDPKLLLRKPNLTAWCVFCVCFRAAEVSSCRRGRQCRAAAAPTGTRRASRSPTSRRWCLRAPTTTTSTAATRMTTTTMMTTCTRVPPCKNGPSCNRRVPPSAAALHCEYPPPIFHSIELRAHGFF